LVPVSAYRKMGIEGIWILHWKLVKNSAGGERMVRVKLHASGVACQIIRSRQKEEFYWMGLICVYTTWWVLRQNMELFSQDYLIPDACFR
jgi:hypothetical protein